VLAEHFRMALLPNRFESASAPFTVDSPRLDIEASPREFRGHFEVQSAVNIQVEKPLMDAN
jgi:hypothetical protein